MANTTKVKPFEGGTLTHVPLSNIVAHPEIPLARPVNKAHVDELYSSIKANGLDCPLIVWNGGGDGQTCDKKSGGQIPATFRVAGEHRRLALVQYRNKDAEAFAAAFPNGIPVRVIDGELKDVIATQVRENCNRENPSAAEILPSVIRLRDEFGLKQKQIAVAVGKSAAWVSEVLDIEEQLGPEGTDALKEGEVSVRDAIEAKNTVKKAKKAGKPVSAKEALAKAKAKKKAKAVEKKPSLKTVWTRFQTLPSMTVGKKLAILTAAVAYLVGDDESSLPPELSGSSDE